MFNKSNNVYTLLFIIKHINTTQTYQRTNKKSLT